MTFSLAGILLGKLSWLLVTERGLSCGVLSFGFFFKERFFFFNFYLFMIVTEREREAETQAEGEAGSMHRDPDVGLDPGSPGSRPGPKAGAKPLYHPGIPL